jgi:hypothetical protein
MCWIKVEGVVGLVYDPSAAVRACPGKKHPCLDCHFCQMCSDDRCALCRRPTAADDGSAPPPPAVQSP